MKLNTLFVTLITFLPGICGLSAQTSAVVAIPPANVPPPTPYVITSKAANSQVWQRQWYEAAPNGQITTHIESYTEIQSGLNYLDSNGAWEPSKDEINLLPDGSAAALSGQHKVSFPSDILNGTIEMVAPDGNSINSQPALLVLYDGSKSAVIGILTNSIGQLIVPNVVVYTNAFQGIAADLRYTYTKAGFEQDVVLRQRPPDPVLWGLDPVRTRLQIWTEFTKGPLPTLIQRVLPAQAGITLGDASINFGTMQMVPGRAFAIGQNSAAAMVAKSWITVNGRHFLVEEVPLGSMTEAMQNLTASTAKRGNRLIAKGISSYLALPIRHAARNKSEKIKLASLDFKKEPGLVLDYQTVNTTMTNQTFQGNMTYYISGTAASFGTNTFEGGTVLKFASNGDLEIEPSLQNAVIEWQAGPYRPVIFTAKDDNSVGETISGSSGSPAGYYGSPMLNLAGFSPQTPLANLRMSYAQTAIASSGANCSIYDAQFVNCQNGLLVGGATVFYGNALFDLVKTNFSYLGGASVVAENMTSEGSASLASAPGGPTGSSLQLTNCLLSDTGALTNGDLTLEADNNGFYNSPAVGTMQFTGSNYPFQTVGGGGFYLAENSPFYQVGTSNLDPTLLGDLATKTTRPPIAYTNQTFSTSMTFVPQAQRDNSASPDLGFHYTPLDYAIGGCTADTNMTFMPGTAVGWFRTSAGWYHAGQAIQENGNVTVSFNGTVTEPDYWTRLNTVQENDQTGGYGHGSIENWSGPSVPVVEGTFMICTVMAGEKFSSFFSDDYGTIQAIMMDSEFWGGNMETYGDYMSYSNCLIWRPLQLGVNNGSTNGWFVMRNCTMFGGQYSMNRNTASGQGALPVSVRDTSFDGTMISADDTFGNNTLVTDYDYNAYTNNADPFPSGGSHDVPMTNGFNWQSSWLGNFYLPPSSLLLQAGDLPANLLGLFYFTTQTNQEFQGFSPVDIGYHYVSVDGNGNPYINQNGIADYISNPYTNDTSGDGLTDAVEEILGLNPQIRNLSNPSERANYGYTPADWLSGVSGSKSGSIKTDGEGNVTSVSQ